jgi:dolichol-phosphate mannosyltransferase
MSGPVAEPGQILGGPVGAMITPAATRSALVYSVVIPVFNEQENVETVVARVAKVFDEIGDPYEILFVDDGSRDRTPELLRKICEEHSQVRAVRFSRNFGQEAAVQAGYLFARGEWIMQMDGDLQNPPEDVHKLIARRDEGFDFIFGVRRGRKDPIFRKASSSLMRWVMQRLLNIELPRDISTFRLMRASTAKMLASMPERQKFLSALACWVGVKHTTVDVTHTARAAGKTKYNLGKLINHTFDLVVGFSSRPLRMLGVVGLFVAVVGFAGAIWAVVEKLVFGTMMGWSSIFAAVLTMGGMQLAALSLIGEYVARIFVQAQQRPIFMVAEQMGDASRTADKAAQGAVKAASEESPVS